MRRRNYWVTRADGENIGEDYSGFMFYTLAEADGFIREEWEFDREQIKSGYYEPDHPIPTFIIEVQKVVKTIERSS
jgi:hypothetical protein